MTDKLKVLFLCKGNASRSQMAEAIVNARLGDQWQAYSAGSKPAGYVHDMALKVLSEIGIDHQGRSKSLEEFRGTSFDVVITLCTDDEEQCPVWLGKGKQRHMPYPDPGKTAGGDEQKLAAFREVRDRMTKEILDVLENYQS